MLDAFLSAAYSTQRENQEKRATVDALKKLPAPFLAKLASGEVKLSFLNECAPTGSHEETWLDRFKGSPFMEQAMALEEQCLQLDVQDMQRRQERRQENMAEDSIWDQKDQLRIQKKLLELQLYQQMLGGEHAAMDPAATIDPQKKKPVPEAGAPGAGAMGPEAENSEENMAPVGTRGPGDAKTAALVKLSSSPMGKIADAWGRELARSDMKKTAAMPGLGQIGGVLGNAWSKLSPSVRTGVIGGAATGALGAGASAAHDQQGFHPLKALGAAATGGVLGGAAGGALGGVHQSYQGLRGAGVAPGQALRQAVPGGLRIAGGQAQAAGQQLGQLVPKGLVG
jgi:hypothetical protein